MGNAIAPMSHATANCSIDQALPVSGWELALYIFEMAICAAVLISCALFALIVRRTHTFDRNMKALFGNMLCSAFGIASTRLFLIIPQTIADGGLFGQSMMAYVLVFHDLCINVDVLIQVSITLECLFSTSNERQSSASTTFGNTLLAVQTLCPWLFTFVLYLLEQHKLIDTVPEFICLEALNLISWLIFLRLYSLNRRKYRKMSAGNVEKKYQVTVKIRTLRTLLFLSALTSARNCIIMALLILLVVHIVPQCLVDAFHALNHAYDCTVAIYALVLILPLIGTHPEFQTEFRRLFRLGKNTPKIATVSVVPLRPHETGVTVPRNVLGEQLNMSHSANEYYHQLALSWEGLPNNEQQQATSSRSPQMSFIGRQISIGRSSRRYGLPRNDYHRPTDVEVPPKRMSLPYFRYRS